MTTASILQRTDHRNVAVLIGEADDWPKGRNLEHGA
jgi:hypothetical protein